MKEERKGAREGGGVLGQKVYDQGSRRRLEFQEEGEERWEMKFNWTREHIIQVDSYGLVSRFPSED